MCLFAHFSGMKIFKEARELNDYLEQFRANNSIGFVPTMGSLHQGHLSLLQSSIEENDITLASVFVNPTQFNNKEDLEKYPRNFEKDRVKLESVGCDIVFFPSVDQIYTKKVESESFDLGNLENIMEGKHRPGHFQGVMTVVKRFFEIIEPDRAYFGKKDFQQLLVIKKLVRDFNLGVKIIPCRIVREDNGLAMSSRNERLTEMERERAGIIYQALRRIHKLKHERSLQEAKKVAEDMINMQQGMKVEYFEIADAQTLQPFEEWREGKDMIACVSAYCGDVRLIDNMEV